MHSVTLLHYTIASLVLFAVLAFETGDCLGAEVKVLGSPLQLSERLPAGPVPQPSRDTSGEAGVASQLEEIGGSPEELRAFFLEMPKGADLHNHLTGAVYTESLIDQAAYQGLCVDVETCDLWSPPCRPGEVPASQAYGNSSLYNRMVDDWSMRNHELLQSSGHDHFFAIFPEIDPVTGNVSAILAELRHRAAIENVQYIEIMLTEPGASSTATSFGKQIGWNGSLPGFYGALKNKGLDGLAWNASKKIEEWESGSLSLLGCGSPDADPGCNVTVRYIYYALRTQPREKVFAQLCLAFEVARKSPLVVGVNLVGPEDDWAAREDYSAQMEMVRFLNAAYPDVPIALHAGELAPGLVPPEDLRFHIREAVLTANASRIGHGVDIMAELDSEDTLRQMAGKGVAVEIMPSSNEEILEVEGSDHPLPVYVDRGVPVVLASDDPGILRTDLTEQFVLAAYRYPELDYKDFKGFVRNSLEYSFLSGEGIWLQRGVYAAFRPELEGCDPMTGNLTQAGKGFLNGSEKAREEWRLEEELAEFEEERLLPI